VGQQPHPQHNSIADMILYFGVRPELIVRRPSVKKRERRENDRLGAPEHVFAFAAPYLGRPQHTGETAVADRRNVLVKSVIVVIDHERQGGSTGISTANLSERPPVL